MVKENSREPLKVHFFRTSNIADVLLRNLSVNSIKKILEHGLNINMNCKINSNLS